VTLSTIHTAKGLEWPVVILAGTRGGPDPGGRLSGTFWSDPSFGPVYMGNQAERGDRSERLFRGALAEDHAEEARLLYVAATRARDRLIISGPTKKAKGYAEWLKAALEDAVEAHEAPKPREGGGGVRGDGEGRERRTAPATDDDSATGTGRQLDAFGFDHALEDERGQLSMFAPRRDSGADGGPDSTPAALPFTPAPIVLFRTPDPIQESLAPTPVELWWLDGLRECAPAPITRPIETPCFSFSSSATELRLRDQDPEAWELRYGHGVVPAREFTRRFDGADLPATVRGVLIHTVLERLEAESELSRILGEAIAGLDAPELETLLEPGSLYREKLREEIASVVRSAEWSHYVEGEHWRELAFLHVRGAREWRLGAFDLFRPVTSAGVGEAPAARIVDFKTHEIGAANVPETAATYAVQADVYRDAAATILGRPVQVSLHFTHPNVAIDV
jgi:hypothetical protein